MRSPSITTRVTPAIHNERNAHTAMKTEQSVINKIILINLKAIAGTSLVVQWLELHTSTIGAFPRNFISKECACTAGDPGSIPGLG